MKIWNIVYRYTDGSGKEDVPLFGYETKQEAEKIIKKIKKDGWNGGELYVAEGHFGKDKK